MKILIVDDNLSLAKGLSTFLRQEGHEPQAAHSLKEALARLAQSTWDLIITDLKLPDGSGIEVIKRARGLTTSPEVILMTAYGNVETAVEAMKLGALDYLTKPVPMEEFAFRVDRVAKMRNLSSQAEVLKRANETLLESTGLTSPLDELVGSSPGILQVKELIRKAAPFPSTVLITGETGTGKEMVARAIHTLSPWSGGPFVRVNCASIPDTLFESELFGHEKGAFTDARERRIGRFEAARGGTLFLDEVGEVPINLQSKLLRALQEKEINRVGGTQPIIVDTRIVAATNRQLDSMAQQGSFREDLLYRLAVIRIHMPALRQRQEDIPAIADRLLSRLKTEFGKTDRHFSAETSELLQHMDWQGNVRELKNALERSIVMAPGPVLSPDLFLPMKTSNATSAASAHSSGEPSIAPAEKQKLIESLEELERTMIQQALERSNGVKSRAAEELGIPRTNLLYRMKRLGISAPDQD